MYPKMIPVNFDGERIIKARILQGGSCKLLVEPGMPNNECEVRSKMLDDTFALIEASKLSLADEFMQYKPMTVVEEEYKELFANVICKGIKDFYRPRYDPSYSDRMHTCVTFKPGREAVTDKPYKWWVEVAKKFMPEWHSCIGTKSQYVAFCAWFIKQLILEGWTVKQAWRAVCYDSKELACYNANTYQKTGSREHCGLFDLGNTYKFLVEDEDEKDGGFWLASGAYYCHSQNVPIAILRRHEFYERGRIDLSSVGWFVLS